MPKGRGKAAFKGSRGSKNAAAPDDAMAFKRASRVNKITNAQDAAFEGQDAFGLGDDEIALDGHTNGADGALLQHSQTGLSALYCLKYRFTVAAQKKLQEVDRKAFTDILVCHYALR